MWSWDKTELKYLYMSCDLKKKTNVLHTFQFKIGKGLEQLCVNQTEDNFMSKYPRASCHLHKRYHTQTPKWN